MSTAEPVAGPEAEESSPSTDSVSKSETHPLRGRAILCLLAIVALADLAIYRGAGFAGYALLLAASPLLVFIGIAPRNADRSLYIAWPLLILIAARLLWCGDWLAVAIGFSLLFAVTMALVGLRPYVLETIVFAAQTIPAGFQALRRRGSSISGDRATEGVPGPHWSAILIPLPIILIFSAIFILANPDLATWFNTELSRTIRQARDWLFDVAPEPLEMIFWVGTAWIAAGLLRPLVPHNVVVQSTATDLVWPEEAPLYAAFRNTLTGLIVLFAVYLIFEFFTLWFREFPEGFHYSGYAHEGAAWLTAALALATLLLSVIFQGRTLRDPRVAVLRRFAGIWAVENLLLALAVYNRLFIYIGFNGMTRMRIVGMLGITAVVIGFILVLIKIRRNHSFTWLIRRHLWTLAAAFYLYTVLPVDVIAMGYNVRRIMHGDPAPSVQISEHPISVEGVLVLKPLLNSDNTIIREGVRAMLAARLEQFKTRPEQNHWTDYQLAEETLESQLRTFEEDLNIYRDRSRRATARRTFAEYAYQWW